MYTHYNIKTGEYTPKSYTETKTFRTSFYGCTELVRCNNHKKCTRCQNLWRKRDWAQSLNHTTEKHFKNWKFKTLLTIVSLKKEYDAGNKNKDIDLFMSDLIKSKRYVSSILFNSQYFSNKHISYTKEKGYNPHIHMILLSTKEFEKNKHLQKLLKKYKLRINSKTIRKANDNSFKTSIQKIVNYLLKFEKSRIDLERKYNITTQKKDIRKSNLFIKRKHTKKSKHLLNHIRDINTKYKKLIKLDIALFKNYNKKKPKTYIRMHKSVMKKIKLHNSRRAAEISRL